MKYLDQILFEMDSSTFMLWVVVIQRNPIEVDLYLTVQMHTNKKSEWSYFTNAKLQALAKSLNDLYAYAFWLAG